MNNFISIADYHADLLRVQEVRSVPTVERLSDCIKIYAPNGKDFCLIDFEDEDLANLSWAKSNQYFARRVSRRHPTKASSSLYLHRLILERILDRPLERDEITDHANGDKSDNRRCNLRVGTKADNAYNVAVHQDAESKFKGVAQSGSRYRCQIRYSVSISEYCDSEEDAARLYDELAAKHHGRFAKFNFPEHWIYDLIADRWVRVQEANYQYS